MNTRVGIDEMMVWMNDSGAKVIVVDARFSEVPGQLAGRLLHEMQAVYVGVSGPVEYEALLAAAEEHSPAPDPVEEDLIGLFYTSGTTGGPEGVMLTNRNICANALHIMLGLHLDAGSVLLHIPPLVAL